jgi:hypothetical protein
MAHTIKILRFNEPSVSNIVINFWGKKTFVWCILENLVNDFFVVIIKSHWKNLLNDLDKFEFHDGLLYHDGLMDYYTYQKALCNFKFLKLDTTH